MSFPSMMWPFQVDGTTPLLATVGAWGWQHPAWEDNRFYPDDMPPEWQLSFYSNEFDCVVVPADQCVGDAFDPESWLDDVDEEFIFFVEYPLALTEEQEIETFIEQLAQLQGQLGAILVDQEAPEPVKAMLESSAGDIRVLYFDAQNRQLMNPDASLLLVQSDSSESLRELGQRLKALTENGCEYLILSNPEPAMERLKEIRTLLDVLGV